jgi:serine-type D-Ala-D-Ala carboxypeptidase (penicillin-binding protein 5/6)
MGNNMNKKIIGKWVAISIAVLVIAGSMLTEYSRRPAEEDIDISAKAAIIINAGNGQVLYEKNADERLQPASIVKVMTAIVAMKNMGPEDKIIATDAVNNVEPTNADLDPGVEYKLKDLIAAILIKSANDAAVAIAVGISGSEEEFAKLMNREGARLRMNDTNFTNSSGLPAHPRIDQYTTARDMAKMMRYVIKNSFIIDEMAKKEEDIYGSDGRKIHLTTHNKSLFSEKKILWGKTGYTIKAQRTFIGVDPSKRPKVVIALLKSKTLWKDMALLKEHGLRIHERRRGILARVISKILNRE